jgi:hypothetical protein
MISIKNPTQMIPYAIPEIQIFSWWKTTATIILLNLKTGKSWKNENEI